MNTAVHEYAIGVAKAKDVPTILSGKRPIKKNLRYE